MRAKYLSPSMLGLFSIVIITVVTFPESGAAARQGTKDMARFGVCPANISKVLIVKGGGDEEEVWHMAITLNDAGSKQFQSLQAKHLNKSVELAFDGASLGRARINGPIASSKVHLTSQSWLSLDAAKAQMALLGNKTFDVPCGLIQPRKAE